MLFYVVAGIGIESGIENIIFFSGYYKLEIPVSWQH